MAIFELKSEESKASSGISQLEGLGNDVLIANARWFVHLRWGVAFVLACAAVAGRFTTTIYTPLSEYANVCWPCSLAVILLISNIFFSFGVGRLSEESSRRSIYIQLWMQITLDLIVLTAVVHYVGSIETYVAFTYLFHVVLACIFFSRFSSLMVTLLASALYVSCIALEISGLWDPVCILQGRIAPRPEVSFWIFIYPASAILVWLVVWYLVSTLSVTLQLKNAEIRRINKQLLKAGDEKNQHMLKITHDLKAPFSGIESNIQMLRYFHWETLTEEVKNLVERIEIRSKTLRERIQEILLLGDLRGGSEERRKLKIQRVELRDIFEEVMDEVSSKAADREIRIDLNIPEVSFRSSRRQLVRLFSNLLANAVLYSPEGESVQVVGREVSKELVVSIKDHGIGISENALPHIFEEFYISKEGARFNKLSSGLGLAIVREIVDLLGLRIRVESAVGQGARFDILLPTVSADAYNNSDKIMAKIQVIDDEVDLADNLKVLLEKEGHEAYVYHEVEGAVDEVDKNAPDLLILDVMFPGNNSGGFEIAREIRTRAELRNLPIIMLTGINQQMPVDFSVKDIDSDWMPVQDFIEKPVNISVLLGKIQELL